MTFAVVGRNEAELLRNALGQALEAADGEDRVWFVDSGSSDGSAEVAAQMGVEVLGAPAGKGRAIAATIERCRGHGQVCFLDGDIEDSEVNIPRALADGLAATGADMVIGEFDWPEKRFWANGFAIYEPLVAALFPEAAGRMGRTALSGFRALDPEKVVGPIPPGWGAEIHLNVSAAAAGLDVAVVELGRYRGPVRDKVGDSAEMAAAILDHAERTARLASSRRPAWEDWVEAVAREIRTWPGLTGPGGEERVEEFNARVREVAARPLPPAIV